MASAPVKNDITMSDLDKIDIRVGRILSLEDVAGSDKLVLLKVSFGDFERQIVVGMKQERENPSEVVGKQALFVVNLKPRMVMGIESQGMLYDIGYADGITPVLAMPEKEIPNGTRVS